MMHHHHGAMMHHHHGAMRRPLHHHLQEIVFTRNATEAINLVAWGWGLKNLKPGDEVGGRYGWEGWGVGKAGEGGQGG